jgi:hypothetical protein
MTATELLREPGEQIPCNRLHEAHYARLLLVAEAGVQLRHGGRRHGIGARLRTVRTHDHRVVRLDGVWFSAEGELRTGPGAPKPLWGGRVSAGLGPEALALALRIDAGHLQGEAPHSLGQVSMELLFMGIHIAYAKPVGRWRYRLGPRFELGRARATGVSDREDVIVRRADLWVSTGGLGIGVDVALAGPLFATGQADLALPLRGLAALADGQRVAGFYGFTSSACVGLGLIY